MNQRSNKQRSEKNGWVELTKKNENTKKATDPPPEDTTLGIKYGEHQLKVISANIDDLRNATALRGLDIRMGDAKADLICIPETHETISAGRETQRYRYISAAAHHITGKTNEKGNGGVAIRIKKARGSKVTEITRNSHRRMAIQLQTNMNKRTLHLISTYAPRM